MASVSFKNISKHYTKDESVIKGVDFTIEDGEFVVFVGPSGCGKSTLLRMVAGLEDITDGEIYIGDVLANDLHASKRGVAMVFQSYALYPHMTVQQNMGFALKMASAPKAEIELRVRKAAEILQITHLLDRKPKALSGGQRQRVAIGRAIVRQPKVFLFDEPLSNLDASLRQNMRIELSKLHHELGTTMIYVTHDQVEAMTLADRIVVFNAGKVQQVGSPLDLYDNPCNLFVAGFLGAPRINLLKGRLIETGNASAEIILPGGQNLFAAVDASSGVKDEAVTLGIRPEHLQLSSASEAGSIAAKVVLIEHLGDQILAYLRIAGVAEELCMKLSVHKTNLRYDDTVHITLPASNCMLFDKTDEAFVRLI
ncbi:ABC transporter ATP-binding protein [Solimicrobium silvestre]|uniref:ABC-type sugar transport systems ATPase component n=1 Tax=Solimicrobium silvestre TaxID=2099400 RepID=A0A2S9H3V8_9BURK|nr:sn-glycerol-3-phosphate ABC transporter ATP-binding protein UgpC [Solimicrobium silvestre]PRC94658.1 ABC-type sugar transport systems ATPase component [Solimicrobium silvestre]